MVNGVKNLLLGEDILLFADAVNSATDLLNGKISG